MARVYETVRMVRWNGGDKANNKDRVERDNKGIRTGVRAEEVYDAVEQRGLRPLKNRLNYRRQTGRTAMCRLNSGVAGTLSIHISELYPRAKSKDRFGKLR